ncbi:MAG: hypothetical protein ACRDT4_13470 [Micromonosporaceae bacterium]
MPEFERPIRVAEPRGDGADVIESDRPEPARRRLLGGLALAVAVGLFAAADVGPAQVGPAPSPPKPKPPPAIAAPPVDLRAPLAVDLPWIALDLPGDVTSFDILPAGYAVATAADCPPGAPCRVSLATSTDLRIWLRRTLPRDATDNLDSPDVVALAPKVLLLVDYGEQTPGGWFSPDDGRSWHPVRTSVRPALAEVTGRLTLDPDPSTDLPCTARGVAVYDSYDGQRVPLREQSQLRPCTATPFPDAAGRLWVAGLDGGYAAVAVSPDRGRRWHSWRLPGTKGARYVHVTVSDRHGYAVVVGKDGRPTIYRYASRGWTQVWRADGTEPAMGLPVVCLGGLLLAEPRPLDGPTRLGPLVSRDGGHSWSRAARLRPILAAVAVPRFGWIGWYDTQPRRPMYSRDCLHWYGVSVG